MTWSKNFIRANIDPIKKDGSVWVAVITYSYFGIYYYTDTKYFESKSEAKEWVCDERCDGRLVINLSQVDE